MAITINWGTKVITVPKADMTLVQSTPVEIYELDLDAFRLVLKDIEDSEEGMVFPDIHNHNTEVTIGSITLARVVEILNGYTITFEDGQYAVDLVGANSNVMDVINANQVSVRANNSAGLTCSEAILAMQIVTDKLDTMVEDAATQGNSQFTEEALTNVPECPASVSPGLGSVVVDWNYGGNDFRYLTGPGGTGIVDASVYAYLKDDYDNNRREAQFIKAQTWTNILGEWRHPMNLDEDTYTLYYFKRGQYGPDTVEVVVS
ncbi:MAG: hypothetical protein KAS32_11665 [Candidatus Peribacteraceae bacterium]|nr:hypothetical protein [Candidatus Peribacteraceae bacterium]